MFLHYNRYENYRRIRDLGMVVPFSNSERINFACPRLWSYKHVQNYRIDDKSEALSYGIIWHTLLEHILILTKESGSFMNLEETMEYVDTTLEPIIEAYYMDSENEDALNEQYLYGNIQEIKQRIHNAIPGWHKSWTEFLKKFKVLEVELAVCAPVLDIDGQIALFPTYVMWKDEYVRPSRIGEMEESELLSLPYYKIGKIDALVEDMDTGELWICDHKTSGSPAQYENTINYDVQLPSYSSLLDYEINFGSLTHLAGKKIAGVIYDISHSKIKDIPELLKSGKLSKAKNAGTPSWIYERGIEKYDLPRSEYKDHLQYLRNNADPKKNYQRYFYLTQEDIDRCTDEDYGIAMNMSERRKRLVEISEDSIVDYNAIAYRYPACQKYGNCTFSSFCLANTQPSVIELEMADHVRWSAEEEIPTLKSSSDLPF
jgi:hypothetical protein